MTLQGALWGDPVPFEAVSPVEAPRPVWGDYTAQKRQHCGTCEQAGMPVRARRVRTVGNQKTYYCRACAEPIEKADRAAGPAPAAKRKARLDVA
jgi:hypothetical protein